ncbi:MAG: hypothetical protein QM767_30570 [Anaeromyxobacter sp.]
MRRPCPSTPPPRGAAATPRTNGALPLLAACSALLLAGCGDELVGGDYPGEPLATLGGSMVPTPETELSGPVRLAVAWYPQWLSAEDPSGGAAPPTVVTEDVEAQGTFPVEFRFPIYRPPPRAAQAPLGGGLDGRGSFGVLLAYQDLDGDRQLDLIPEDGAPVDRVIGSSLLGDPRATFALVYVDSAQPAESGLAPGFNLVQALDDDSAAVVPLTSRTRLSLTSGGPVYDAFVCQAGWLTFLLADVCGLWGGGGGDPETLAYDGRVVLDGDRLEISLTVTGPSGPVTDAAVQVNGRPIPWDDLQGAYVLSEPATTLVAPGSSFLVSVTGAGVSAGQVFTMPGEFALEAPADGATVSAADPLLVGWTASAGAGEYYAGFEALPAGGSTTADAGALSISFDARAAQPGQGSAFVEARIWPEDGRAFVVTALVRRTGFWVVP